MQLAEIIIQRIRKEGPISFRDFMDMSLYYPEMGYYTSAGNPIGSKGDFYTSSTLTPVFGAMIGRQIEEMWKISDSEAFTIIEYGSGTGVLCKSILDFLKTNKELFDSLNYCIIEKSAYMQTIEKNLLKEKVSWFNSIAEIPETNCCVLSNRPLA